MNKLIFSVTLELHVALNVQGRIIEIYRISLSSSAYRVIKFNLYKIRV